MNSKLKTWLKRNGFKGEGYPGDRMPMRECRGYVVRSGRRFRIRHEDVRDVSTHIVVDIGETHDTFDRWANSTERTVWLSQFMNEFKRTNHD